MANEQADGRANAYGKPRRFQNPHVPLNGPVHCTDDNLYNPPPAEKVEHVYAADNAFALGQTQRFAVGHDYTGNPVMNGAVAAVAHDYRTTAECVKAHAQPPRAAAPLAHEAEQGPTYAAWKGPSSSGAPAGTKADAEANLYYQPAVASFKGKDKFGNLDIGKEYANARETMTDAVHGGMSHADAEALLLAHGAVAGCYLLHARSLGVYTMTICTRGGKKKGKAKFAHHVLESTHTGFVFNGNTMAKLCTTLGDAVQHLKDNASKGKLKVKPDQIVMPQDDIDEFC